MPKSHVWREKEVVIHVPKGTGPILKRKKKGLNPAPNRIPEKDQKKMVRREFQKKKKQSREKSGVRQEDYLSGD